MDREELELERWRAALMSELGSPEVGVSTRALLAMTFDDPDRERARLSSSTACLLKPIRRSELWL